METTAIYYSIVAPIYIQRYYPPETVDSSAVELLSLLGTILAIPSLIPGTSGAVASGISAVLGVLGGAIESQLGDDETAIDNAADLAQYVGPVNSRCRC